MRVQQSGGLGRTIVCVAGGVAIWVVMVAAVATVNYASHPEFDPEWKVET